MNYTLYVDMDEVICDFIGGACQACGVSRESVEAKRVKGSWHIEDIIMELSGRDMWKEIEKLDEDFWVDLKPLPWTDNLISLLESKWDWHIATTPRYSQPWSLSGKIKWLNTYFGRTFINVIPILDKSLLSRRGAFLIDDKEDNCKKFSHIDLGGRGIVFPSYGNHKFNLADDPLSCQEVHSLLNRIIHF